MENAPINPGLLAARAKEASANAYAPYSKFKVGAAVAAGGRIYTGCNVENASFGLTMCAERNAVAAAIAAGETTIEAIAIYTDTDDPTPPCGACRQVLAEFGGDIAIHLAARDGKTATYQLGELLPRSFKLLN
ncbi:cytidine deaminase [Candidatus Sumerlaeota bacterium]|nr:cytidine deaminase [Candidatus Sumerlaeota bacterium]